MEETPKTTARLEPTAIASTPPCLIVTHRSGEQYLIRNMTLLDLESLRDEISAIYDAECEKHLEAARVAVDEEITP